MYARVDPFTAAVMFPFIFWGPTHVWRYS
jgi:hypothetical protein